ncbi:CotH kinase family protein [Mycoplasmatota bacterium WC30]
MKLVLKRIILIFLLTALISVLAVYVSNHSDEAEVTQYMNLRDQTDDYDRLFDNSNFKTFTISFEEDIFDTMLINMQEHFDVYGNYIDNTIYPVNLTYTDSTENFTILEVGFRTKSTTSRNLLMTTDWRNREIYHQTSFQLEFNNTFEYLDNTNINQILGKREVFNLEQLNFEYSQIYDSQYDETMISEAYTHYLYEQAGVLAAKASYCIVYLKVGDTIIGYGLYTIIEPIDSEFLKNNFDSDAALEYGDLYKVTDVAGEGTLDLNYEGLIGISNDDFRFTYALRNNTTDETRKTHTNFESFVENINDFEYFKDHYDSIIDIDMFTRYLAISFLVGNSDDLRYNFNNYYLYFDVYTNKATFIPFDLDNTLGFGKSYDLSGDFMTDYSIYFNLNDPSPLIENIFKIPDLVVLYDFYLNQFINEIFNFSDFETMYLEAIELYENILILEDHLGNKEFDLRNIEWYFDEKTRNVMQELT